MSRSRVALALCTAALVCAASGSSAARAGAPTTQEITIAVSGGTQLACGLVLPDGSPPSGGWPGLLLFPPLGQAHYAMEDVATADFAPAGFASLTCDARGTKSSGGKLDLAGPADVQDVQDLFAWLAARSDVSDTEIGAFGLSIGGAEIWNAAVAGVPFKAVVPVETWTSLSQALTPDGAVKSGLLDILESLYRPSTWDSTLAQARADLNDGHVTGTVRQALAARSSRKRLHSLSVPALMIQGRRDSLFDLRQPTAAYRLLRGPKRLYVGDAGHALNEVVAWFQAYLAGGAPVGGDVELEHASDGTTTSFPGLPPTRLLSVDLPGTTRLTGQSRTRRSVRLPGGPLETFGGGSVTVRYSGATPAWTQLVATVYVKGKSSPVTQGAAPITAAAGVVTIPLLSEAVLLPPGPRLVVKLGQTPTGVFGRRPGPGAAITLGRATLALSVLNHAVSR